MEKLLFRVSPVVLGTAMLLMTGGAQAAVVDIAQNGGFETGDFTGWTQFPSAGTTQTIISPGATGTYAANLNVSNDGAVNNVLKQQRLLDGTGQLGPGSVINFSFDYRGSSADGGVLFVKSICETATATCGDFLEPALFGAADWTSVSGTAFALGADATAYTLEFAAVCGAAATCLADFDIDNVVITADIAAIPVPAAAWLFGSALLGLGGAARRKRQAA